MKDWRRTLVNQTQTILDAIRIIDEAAVQIAMVVNDEGRLLGTVTDGDIRRAILKGMPLDEKITKAMNPNPKYIYEDEPYEKLLTIFQKSKVHHIPIVDRHHRIVGLELLDEIFHLTQKENPVILMAGGLGMRLRPLTEHCPKPMLKVGNKPILETILENLIAQGFYRFYISVNYKREIIEQYFGDGQRWGVDIQYLREDKPLGTAGALSLLPETPELPLIIMNGDILTKVNFKYMLDFHREHQATATMAIREYTYQVPYGVVQLSHHRIEKIEEKPVKRYFVNAGIYILDPKALDYVHKDAYLDMPTLFEHLMVQGMTIAGFPIREYWIDIGQIGEYRRANQEFDEVFR